MYGCGDDRSPGSKSGKQALAGDSSALRQDDGDQENVGSDKSDSGTFERYNEAARLLKAWNAAINANEPETLLKLYAGKVEYYLQTQSGQACADQKSDWLGKHPKYSQQITEQQIYFLDTDTNATVLIAEFMKVCTDQGKTTRIPSMLYFSMADGALKITRETDLHTEASRAKRASAGTLKKGDYSFWRGYWKDTRNVPQFAHDMVSYWFSIDISVGNGITGEYLTYSGEMRSIVYSFIPEGTIRDGILDLTVVDCSSLMENITMEEYKSGEYDHLPKRHMHFKIISGNTLVNLDKGEWLYGKSMSLREKDH